MKIANELLTDENPSGTGTVVVNGFLMIWDASGNGNGDGDWPGIGSIDISLNRCGRRRNLGRRKRFQFVDW